MSESFPRSPDDSPASSRDRLRLARGQLASDLRAVKSEASEVLDWRSYVRKHPLATVGAAAAAAYLLAPRTTRVVQLTDKQLRELATEGGVQITSASTASKGSSTLGSALLAVGAVVTRTVVGHAIGSVMNSLNSAETASASPFAQGET